jgi:hypothetical protein
MDLLELGDAVGARGAHVLLDDRTFPTESLFSPFLADLNGPSVVFYFDAVLTCEEVVRLLMSHKSLVNKKYRSILLQNGHGLLSSFQYTVCDYILLVALQCVCLNSSL